ncbi:unnamed protein product, partial [Prunus brigantina]
DITVLGRSPLFDSLTEGNSPQLDYYINGRRYNMGYYLADGIYPKWATLVQSIRHPENAAEEYFSTKQEAYHERDDYYDGESDDEDSDPNRSRRARALIYDGAEFPRDPRTYRISMESYMSRYRAIRCPVANNGLREDLVAHLWNIRGQEQ